LTVRRAGLSPATLKIKSIPAPQSGGIAASLPARYPANLSLRPFVNTNALVDQIAKRNSPAAVTPITETKDQIFSTFAYTGNGLGGGQAKLAPGILAYSDDATRKLFRLHCKARTSYGPQTPTDNTVQTITSWPPLPAI
jgi:beta-galactosidase